MATLEPLDSTEKIVSTCSLCLRIIWTNAYTYQERSNRTFYHKACVEAPHQIDRHPLHPLHPLTLIHVNNFLRCDACHGDLDFYCSLFGCVECGFYLDICCALSTLSDGGGSQCCKTSEQITLPLHPHTLTSFSTRHDFVWCNKCYICWKTVEGDGYTCLRRFCDFVIHKRCIQDLYYTDGIKASRVYHGHPLEIFVREDTSSITCASCGSDKSGEFIGCASCQVFYHRHCFQVPEVVRYPSHHPDHTLVLFPDFGTQRQCQSCSGSLWDEIYYSCTSCDFFVHVRCASQVLTYCKEGMSARIELVWHNHPLLLCHATESNFYYCNCCKEKLIGPSYVCEEKDCGFLLHKECTELDSTIDHPHHPDHPLILCKVDDDDDVNYSCKACCSMIEDLKFSCERCLFDLHVKCAARFPTQKHYLHEHKLLRFERNAEFKCNRCCKSTASPFFRCVQCNFNLHEECMELPPKVTSKIHWHPLTLHETFVEDDSGEYYCEECETTRDPRLGAYVCGQCKLILPRIYHIECVLPELAKVYAKDSEEEILTSELEKLNQQIANKKEKLTETMREFDELKNHRDKLLERLPQWKNSFFCRKRRP